MKTKRIIPNYNNILNLMSSIGSALSWKSKYKPLKNLNIDELKNSKNIVLMTIDGLSYDSLTKNGKF